VQFQFENIHPSNPGTMVVDVPLTVPHVGGSKGGCTLDSGSNLPHGMALIAGGAAAAMLRRRRMPAKA